MVNVELLAGSAPMTAPVLVVPAAMAAVVVRPAVADPSGPAGGPSGPRVDP
jgi:hypothetical protein